MLEDLQVLVPTMPFAAAVRGWTPLRVAAEHNHIEVAKLLLAAGASPHTTDNDGRGLDGDAELGRVMASVRRGFCQVLPVSQ